MAIWLSILVSVASLVVAVLGGWPVTAAVLGLAGRSRDTDPHQATSEATAALRGGTWIGILERLAVCGAILLGYPAAIAVVVAVKGLGRYPELRNHPAASERFVIGTLASMIWAAAIGVAGQALLSL
jgi:hypothetical protein